MFDPWVRKISWRRAWQPTPVFLPGESHEQRSLGGYSPQGIEESDMTEHRTGYAISPWRLMCVLSHFSRVQLIVTPWTLRPHQAPLSLGFSRQEYWSRLPIPSPGDLPDKGIKPTSPEAPALQADFFTAEPRRKLLKTNNHLIKWVLSSPPWGDAETKAYRRATNCPRSTIENGRVGIWIPPFQSCVVWTPKRYFCSLNAFVEFARIEMFT